MEKSMLEIAYEIMQEKKNVAFSTLYSSITKKLGLSEEDAKKKVANFYTQLSLDGRFVAVGNNKWSLRDRLPSEKTHIDMSAVYNDMDETSEDDDEEEEAEESSTPAENKKEETAI